MILLSACKTVDDEPVPAQVQASEPQLPPPALAEISSANALEGFNRDGASVCLPLPQGRTCIKRQDKLATACLSSGGETLVCEDCAVLCSKPLTVQ